MKKLTEKKNSIKKMIDKAVKIDRKRRNVSRRRCLCNGTLDDKCICVRGGCSHCTT